MVYTLQQRIEIVTTYFENGRCARTTARIFNTNHPEGNLRHASVIMIINKFMETGSVQNIKHERNRPVRNEGVEVAVIGHVLMDNKQSLRQIASASGVSKSSVQRILKEQNFHPYKIRLVHELNEDDYDRRLQFCENVTELLIHNPHYSYNICFSDECSFYVNGHVNKHNCRYWSDTKPNWYREEHTQTPQKLNVWAGILGNRIIGPFFIPGHLNGENYLQLLETLVDPFITQVIEEDENFVENQLVFQQDGAPPHCVAPVREFLNNRFPNRWMGRRGAIEWPARSPDLTPLDFFLWGHLKNKIYVDKPASLDDLRQKIINECQLVTPEILSNVRRRFEQNLYYCAEANGAQFEHLIK
jgi:ribosomal protein S13